jgi:hypothetical protein
MHDKGIERRKAPGLASEMESVHEPGDKMGITAVVQLLRSGEAGSGEHPRVGDRLPTVFGSVLHHEIDRRVHLSIRVAHGSTIALDWTKPSEKLAELVATNS